MQQFEDDLADGFLLARKVLTWLDSSDEWKVFDFPLENDALLKRVRAAALFLTAFLDELNTEISLRLPVFIKTRFAWDIGPARLAEECTA